MKTLSTLVIATVIVAIGILGIAYSGIIDVGANSPHGGFDINNSGVGDT